MPLKGQSFEQFGKAHNFGIDFDDGWTEIENLEALETCGSTEGDVGLTAFKNRSQVDFDAG